MNDPTQTREYYTIYSQRLAGFLMGRGFVLIQMKPNRDNTGRNVFYFVKSNELEKAICEYQDNNKKQMGETNAERNRTKQRTNF